MIFVNKVYLKLVSNSKILTVLTHNIKRHLRCSGLIIRNLVGRVNRTPDHCYNNNMTITPLAQTSCNN